MSAAVEQSVRSGHSGSGAGLRPEPRFFGRPLGIDLPQHGQRALERSRRFSRGELREGGAALLGGTDSNRRVGAVRERGESLDLEERLAHQFRLLEPLDASDRVRALSGREQLVGLLDDGASGLFRGGALALLLDRALLGVTLCGACPERLQDGAHQH